MRPGLCGGAARFAALCAALSAVMLAVLSTAFAQPARSGSTVEAPPLRSGFSDMSPAVQALQRDDSLNPAALWLQAGTQRFAADCARCHTLEAPGGVAATQAPSAAGNAPLPLAGVAARYPAFDTALGRPLTLAGRINQCRVRHVGAPAWPAGHEDALALEMAVGQASRGQPLAPPADPRLATWQARGQALFRQRIGQLDLSCAQCHDDHAGRRLAGSTIPQGHPNAYPIYRLEWQGVGGLPRRLRNCMTGVRAEPYAADSDEMLALEVYLAQRAAGLAVETPGVRP